MNWAGLEFIFDKSELRFAYPLASLVSVSLRSLLASLAIGCVGNCL